MRIVIVGGGVVGYSLAEHLLVDRHRLSLIELEGKLCDSISSKLDVNVVCGSGSSPASLLQAGLAEADLILAVTPVDEVNMLACAVAAQYDVKRRIARLRSRELAEDSEAIDLSRIGVTNVIHPEEALVDHILQFVETPHAVESANFESGRILMRGYRVTEAMPIAGKTPIEIRKEIDPDFVLFAAIVRSGQGMIPGGDTRIEAGDTVYSLFPRDSLPTFLRLVNVEYRRHRKIIVTGSSYSTVELARAMDTSDHQVSMVDPDEEHAEKAAAELNRIQVLHGDCTQDDLLRDLNVEHASFFIAASDQAEYNMLSALLAKTRGAHETITTTTEWQHDRLFHRLGIDHVLNPRLTAAREILEIISSGSIGAAVRLSHVDIEAVRMVVESGSKMVGKAIVDMSKPLKGSVIGSIVRQNKMILPTGDTVFEADDHVIVIMRQRQHGAISKLFRGH